MGIFGLERRAAVREAVAAESGALALTRRKLVIFTAACGSARMRGTQPA